MPRAGPGEVPRVHRGEDHRADLRARAADDLPGALAGRPRGGADQPRLPGAIQQRPRAVQGGLAVPPFGLPRDHQVPRVRADLQELPDGNADRRSQGRIGLRSEGEVGQRGDAVLPELHDGAVADHRRAHGRPRGRHRGGRPRDRVPVRAVQAPHEQVRGGGTDGEGSGVGRKPGAHRGDRLRLHLLRRGDAEGEEERVKGEEGGRVGVGQRGDLHGGEGPPARRQGDRDERQQRHHRRREGAAYRDDSSS